MPTHLRRSHPSQGQGDQGNQHHHGLTMAKSVSGVQLSWGEWRVGSGEVNCTIFCPRFSFSSRRPGCSRGNRVEWGLDILQAVVAIHETSGRMGSGRFVVEVVGVISASLTSPGRLSWVSCPQWLWLLTRVVVFKVAIIPARPGSRGCVVKLPLSDPAARQDADRSHQKTTPQQSPIVRTFQRNSILFLPL
jgi:hypothetical protein